MGYSKSKKVVRQFESYLIQLMNAKSTIQFPNKNPNRLGYKLREAIFASQFYDDTKQYANLLSKWILKINGGSITCSLRDVVDEDTIAPAFVQEQLKQEIVIKDVTTIPGVIGAYIKHKGYNMQFPDFIPPDDTSPLAHFCEKFGLTFSLQPHLTLIKNGDNST